MFEQDYGFDDELSGDDGRRSPRGAGGFARRATENAERRINAGVEPMDFGGRRRGERAPFAGDAFGVARTQKALEIDMSSLNGGHPQQRVSELRDYSSKLWRPSSSDLPPSRAGEIDATLKRRSVAEESELALLTGKRSRTEAAGSSKHEVQDTGSSSSSTTSKKKKKKKGKKHKKQKENKTKKKHKHKSKEKTKVKSKS
eukprot:TRINITY_DN28777_c0_g2_i1.p1 TRINITY_DN28777_c0_g2~~TRINITY_DN28777_c0_g2_i1.p1  ORF type:complete len:200 (-),score=36.20 TRINITY_DN28777_c0_g2_i1:313-912(-)